MNDNREAAFAAFFDAERPALLGMAGALTADPAEAHDLVADVIGRAWEQWDRVGAADRPGAYARRMVVNEFVSRKRRSARIVLTPQVSDSSVLADDHAANHAERDELRTRLTALPARQRAAIVLRYYADQSDDQIAATLDCATGTVRSLISRALTALRVTHDASDTPARTATPRASFAPHSQETA